MELYPVSLQGMFDSTVQLPITVYGGKGVAICIHLHPQYPEKY